MHRFAHLVFHYMPTGALVAMSYIVGIPHYDYKSSVRRISKSNRPSESWQRIMWAEVDDRRIKLVTNWSDQTAARQIPCGDSPATSENRDFDHGTS